MMPASQWYGLFICMFHIALHEPQIAPNTGNIMRLIANNGCALHLIEPLGFDLDEKKLRRASLDYRDMTAVTVHQSYEHFLSSMPQNRVIAFTTKGNASHDSVAFQAGDILLFGSETAGLPVTILDSLPASLRLRIPMLDSSRSMNLSNAVAIASYEAWRQLGFSGAQ